MPHIVIEHSTDGHGGGFDAPSLMQALHDAAAATGVMQAGDIKVRARPYPDYLVAGQRDGFCHITVSMLEGRTPEQKVAVSEALRAVMARLLPHTRSLSVDVRDMDAIAYKKRLLD
jgi:5-carboxymethyl-2-hydroxymuconate isomerase